MVDAWEVGRKLCGVIEVVIMQHLWQGRVTYSVVFLIHAFEPHVLYLTECAHNSAIFGETFLNNLGFEVFCVG